MVDAVAEGGDESGDGDGDGDGDGGGAGRVGRTSVTPARAPRRRCGGGVAARVRTAGMGWFPGSSDGGGVVIRVVLV